LIRHFRIRHSTSNLQPLRNGNTTKKVLPFVSCQYFSSQSLAIYGVQADEFYRATKPYAGMDKAAPASSNILLDYPSSHPVSVTVKAFVNGHYRVALFSALSLAATAPPIIATGIFTSTPSSTGLTTLIQPVGFYVSFVILIIYAFCLCMVRPSSRYRLPRCISSINDTFSYCYASRMLDEVGVDGKPIFSAQEVGETRSHLKARIYFAKKQYHFGLYLGKDGRRHMGFNVASRDYNCCCRLKLGMVQGFPFLIPRFHSHVTTRTSRL
jgi:hypothetical protein